MRDTFEATITSELQSWLEVAGGSMAFHFAKPKDWEFKSGRYTLIASMTDSAPSHRSWTGERGLIDQTMISRHLVGLGWPVYYIAGPPQMVKDLHAMLTKQSVNAADIHAEEFSGY